MNISNKSLDSLYDLDKNKNGISYQEIKSLDTNKDGKINNIEANEAGITNQKDINELNENVLKYYSGKGLNQKGKPIEKHHPNEIVFPTPLKPKNPAVFSEDEKVNLTASMNLKEGQDKVSIYFTEKADNNKSQVDKSISEVKKYSKYIKSVSKEHGVSPLLIGAILFDEINHNKGVLEDAAVFVGKATSFGLAQIGLGELVQQGFYTKKGFPPGTKVSKLPNNLIEEGTKYLLNPHNNIKTLAKQIKRNQEVLGYSPDKTLNFDNYFDSHAMAKIASCHNGRYDYPAKIFKYLKNPDLIKALK